MRSMISPPVRTEHRIRLSSSETKIVMNLDLLTTPLDHATDGQPTWIVTFGTYDSLSAALLSGVSLISVPRPARKCWVITRSGFLWLRNNICFTSVLFRVQYLMLNLTDTSIWLKISEFSTDSDQNRTTTFYHFYDFISNGVVFSRTVL
jgi:hypothetical protein